MQTIGNLTLEDWLRCIPYWGIYLVCPLVFVVGVSPAAIVICLLSYLVRMFAITGFYHRYFSHKTFKTSRTMQFVWGVIGAASGQRSPLWWAAHHRQHHRSSDRDGDVHSPINNSFGWSHMFWFISQSNFATHEHRVKDFGKYPELRFLDRYDLLVPILYGLFLLTIGLGIETYVPTWETTASQVLVWGFFVSTVLLHQFTFTVNSIAHLLGTRPYRTKDNSRNNWFIALVTLGEGWHNNHHYYPAATRQGFTWWQIDLTYLVLKLFEKLGLVYDLTPVPQRILDEARTR